MRILIATSPRDLRFCRICLASVRRFHPDAEVRLLPGAPLPTGFLREVARHYDAHALELEPGDYGWGFVKLEPLFRPHGETFLVLDADTVLTGPVLDGLATRLDAAEGPDFLVDGEEQPESEMRRLYYDWDRVRAVDPNAQRPVFVFNSGQWAGRSGVLARADFDAWVEWSFRRKQRYPEFFHNGEQGILNYVLNQKARLQKRAVECTPLMQWPGHGMEGFSAAAIAAGTAPARVIHWAGMKRPRLRDMEGADVLDFFERIYYQRLPLGTVCRWVRAFAAFLDDHIHRLATRVRLFWEKKVRGK